MHQHLQKSDFRGTLECSRYAFMPNKLNYCGGDKNQELFDYTIEGQADFHIESLLSEFATMYPYLKFIARANHIADPFDKRVVEAYWLGNECLDSVNMNQLYNYFIDTLKLKEKFNLKLFEKVIGTIPGGATPHHNFHVFNIPNRTGHYPIEHSLETMDKCRISWGKVLKIEGDFLEVSARLLEIQNHPHTPSLGKLGTGSLKGGDNCPLIAKERRNSPLIIPPLIKGGRGGLLKLGQPTSKKVRYKFNGKGFIANPKVGEMVSIHWDWACNHLSQEQAFNLEKYTRMSMRIYSNIIYE